MDLLTPEAVASGFTVYWVGGQLRLAHHCRNAASIDAPTGALVSWRVRSHRCGTPDSAWHLRSLPHQQARRDLTRPARLARRWEGTA